MRKFSGLKVMVVLVLMAAVALPVMADNATVALTGAVEAGAKIVNSGTGTTIQQYTNNEGTTGWANLSLAATLGDLSANFYLRSSDFATWSIPNAWVTEKFLDKMLELRAGNIDNGVSGTANQGFGGIAGVGIQVVLNPISGMSIGALVPAPLAAVKIDDAAAGLAKTFKVGATYALPSIANIALTYQGAGELDAGVNVTAVSGLTLQLETKIPTTASPTMTFFENAGYSLGALGFAVSSTQTLPSGGSLGLSVTPSVSYTVMPTLTVYGQVGYTLTGNVIAPEVGVSMPWNGMGTLKVQYDGSFATASTNTININFIHNF